MKRLLLIAIAGMTLGSLWPTTARAQAPSYSNSFDNSASLASWMLIGSPDGALLNWDQTLDSLGSEGSGSMKLVAPFLGVTNELFILLGTFANGYQWDMSTVLAPERYRSLAFDLRVAPGTAPTTTAVNYGYLTVGWLRTNYSLTPLAYREIPLSATNWTHFDSMINLAGAAPEAAGVYLSLWSSGLFTNTLTLNVDNLQLVQLPCCASWPTLELQRAKPGLQLLAPSTISPWQRQNIYTVDPEWSWVNASTPASYSLTIAQFPGPTQPDFRAHLLLVPASQMPDGPADPNIDSTATNVACLQIAQNADGTVRAWFAVRTSAGELQAQWVPDGSALEDSSALGTWTLKFEQNTNVTLIGPNGATANYLFPPGALSAFADLVYAYVGVRPNRTGNAGAVVVSRLRFETPHGILEEDFAGQALDPAKWALAATQTNAILTAPGQVAWWLRWPSWAARWEVQMSTDLAEWRNTGLEGQSIILGDKAWMPLGGANAGNDRAFWRLNLSTNSSAQR